MTTIPNLSTIITWLKKLNVTSEQCENCSALHLTHLQKIAGIFDAKISLLDDIITFTIIAEIKLSALSSLMGELSQININTFFAKVYLDLNDDNVAKMVFSYSLPVAAGLSFDQFSLSLTSFEDEALQIISELDSCDLLKCQSELSKELTSSSSQTFH